MADPTDVPEEPEHPETHRRHPWRWALGGVVLLVVLVVGGLAAFVLWPRTPTPITEQQALDEYHRGTDPGSLVTNGGPAPGVYTYDAEGTESITMGPVPLPERTIPAEVTFVVVQTDGECWTTTLNLMAEHTESTQTCRDAAGALSMPSQTKTEQVPGFDVGVENTCDPSTVLSPTSDVLELACDQTFDVSGLEMAVHFTGTATSSPGGDVEVGGTSVATTHVVLRFDGTGDLSGHWHEDWWLTADGLPVRLERDIDLDGPGHFVERSTLILRDLTPRT